MLSLTCCVLQLADEAVCIGEAASSASYLNIPNIIAAAVSRGADAIHPVCPAAMMHTCMPRSDTLGACICIGWKPFWCTFIVKCRWCHSLQPSKELSKCHSHVGLCMHLRNCRLLLTHLHLALLLSPVAASAADSLLEGLRSCAGLRLPL